MQRTAQKQKAAIKILYVKKCKTLISHLEYVRFRHFNKRKSFNIKIHLIPNFWGIKAWLSMSDLIVSGTIFFVCLCIPDYTYSCSCVQGQLVYIYSYLSWDNIMRYCRILKFLFLSKNSFSHNNNKKNRFFLSFFQRVIWVLLSHIFIRV